MSDLLQNALDKLARFGAARNRDRDHEVRYVTLTDDEALAVLERINDLPPEGLLK